MSAPARLAAFGAALAVVLAGSFGAARALDVDLSGDDEPAAAPIAEPTSAGHGDAHRSGAEPGEQPAGEPAAVAGLAADDGTYRLSLTSAAPAAAGRASTVTFRVLDVDGAAVTAYDLEHDKRLHLIVVRRDLAHFQHLHPEMADDGTWSQRLTLPAAGSYRMYADFAVDGDKHTLGTDLAVAGAFDPVPLPEPAPRTSADGYTVTLEGDPRAGAESVLDFSVAFGDRPVEDLQPYLGAKGHLVALRTGDLAYLHVHPTDHEAGSRVSFGATFPSPGTYRLFLQFRHADAVHTAEQTLEVQP